MMLETSIVMSSVRFIFLKGASALIPASPKTRSMRKMRAIRPETTSPVRHNSFGIKILEEGHGKPPFPDAIPSG
jgi:hypothetical protein